MSMVLFNAVPAGAIETLYDEQKQPWFKQVDVGDFVGIVNMRDATCNLSLQDKKSRDEITVGATDGSYKPPKHAKPHDGFLSVNGITTVVINSRKPKAREVTAWLIHDVISRGFNKIIEEKQQAIEGHHRRAIDREREHQLLIADKDDEIRDLVQNRHVPRIGEHDNILCAIEKNEPDELGKTGDHPYYMIRCQRMRLQERLHIKNLQYPNMIIKRPTYDAANSVICWVEFKNYIGKDSYYRNHFSLDNDDHRDLFANTFDIDMGLEDV